MGGHQSRTRKLTVENDDPTSVIKVSDDVVQRIKNSQETKPAVAATPEPPLQQQPTLMSQPFPQQAPQVQPIFIYEPSLTTVQLKQATVTELKKNDEYWQNRLKNQAEQHQKINEIIQHEYEKTMKEMEVQEPAQLEKQIKQLPPCQEAKNAVLKCYKDNECETMKCARLVQAFQECVDLKRASLIANRG